MAKTLEELSAEAEIREIHLRYCRAADRLDVELFRSCFHADAQFEFPIFTGGVDGFIAMAWEFLNKFATTRHFVGNQLVELFGDHAWAEHYTVATHYSKADEQGAIRDYVAHARYIDHLEHLDAWRIVRRTCLMDMTLSDGVAVHASTPRPSDGRRDRSDHSYLFRENIARGAVG